MGILSSNDADLVVELAFGAGPSNGTWLALDDSVRGVLDTAQLADDQLGVGFWVDVTSDVLTCGTRRGRQRLLTQADAGTVVLELDNTTRKYDPTNLSGPYVLVGATLIKPMKTVRIRALYNGVYYPIFLGYADSWQLNWSDSEWATTTLVATDGFKILGNFDPLEVAAVGAGEDSGARINRILDNAGWPTLDRDIDVGDSTMQATNLSQNALTELKLVADSELGDVFMTREGYVRFRRRTAYLEDTEATTAQIWLDDQTPYTDPSQRSYAATAIAYDVDLIRNIANIGRSGGTVQTVQNATSIATYLNQSYTRQDLLLETDAECLDQANWIVSRNSDPELRFNSVTLEMVGGNDASRLLWDTALNIELGARVRIVKRPPGGGSSIDRYAWVIGINHTISNPRMGGGANWTIEFLLADVGNIDSFFILDSATKGVLDTNLLAY